MRFEYIVTGAAGFVGGHLCSFLHEDRGVRGCAALDLLPMPGSYVIPSQTDIRSTTALVALARQWSAPVVVHLAAMAEVVVPFEMMTDLTATNVQGTLNVLEAFAPERVVFASSSAVYGSLSGRLARPVREENGAIGIYGVSKVMGEVICNEWAEVRGGRVVCLRFGNIIGPGCRGLIPYLVAHAMKYPDGSVTVQMRGQGAIIRDYVPVHTAVDAILKSASLPLEAGQNAIFNVGSGTGLANGEVARIVAEVLEEQGYLLDMNFDNPIPSGESESVILDISETERVLQVDTPTPDEVVQSIVQSTLWHLNMMRHPTA